MDRIPPVLNRGVISNWLEAKPSVPSMLTVDNAGDISFQSIPVAEWGSIGGDLGNQTDLSDYLTSLSEGLTALDTVKYDKSGGVISGNVSITPTWNSVGSSFTALSISATNTASTGSLLSKFSVDSKAYLAVDISGNLLTGSLVDESLQGLTHSYSGGILVAHDGDADLRLIEYKNSSTGPTLKFGKSSRAFSLTSGNTGLLGNGWEIGKIEFSAWNGSNGFAAGARIYGTTQGGWTAGTSYPTVLYFQTTPSGSTTPATVLTLDSSGTAILSATGSLSSANQTVDFRYGNNAQRINLFGAYTDSNNYRRLYISSDNNGVFTLGVEGLGTGASNNTLTIANGFTTTGALNLPASTKAAPSLRFGSAASTGLYGAANGTAPGIGLSIGGTSFLETRDSGSGVQLHSLWGLCWTSSTADGTVDSRIVRNATGPAIETRSAGGLIVNNAAGSARAPINALQYRFNVGDGGMFFDCQEDAVFRLGRWGTNYSIIRQNSMSLGAEDASGLLLKRNTATIPSTLELRNGTDSANAALACGLLTAQYGATVNDNVAITSVGTIAGQTNAEGVKYQLVSASGADSLRLASTGYLGFNSTGNLNTGAIDATIRRNATGPTIETRSAGGLRVMDAAGSANAALACGLLTASRSSYSSYGPYAVFLNESGYSEIELQQGLLSGYGGTLTLRAGDLANTGYTRIRHDGGHPKVETTASKLEFSNSLNRFRLAGGYVDLSGSGGNTWIYIDSQNFDKYAGVSPQTMRVFNTRTSATNFEAHQLQWLSNEARVGTAVGSAGGTQRNMVLGGWNAAGTWVPAMTIRPTDSAYPVKFNGSTGIWMGDSTTYETNRIWTSVTGYGIANVSPSFGTGSLAFTGWNSHLLQRGGGFENTTNVYTAFDTDNNDATSAYYIMAGTNMTGNPATNGLVKVQKNGDVGIGTMSPTAKLHVNGTVNCGAITATTGYFQATSNQILDLRNSVGVQVGSVSAANSFLTLHSGGSTYPLRLYGNLTGIRIGDGTYTVDAKPVGSNSVIGFYAGQGNTPASGSLADVLCNAITAGGNLTVSPAASVTPTSNGQLTFEATSDTSLTIKYKGSDGIVRSAVLTLT